MNGALVGGEKEPTQEKAPGDRTTGDNAGGSVDGLVVSVNKLALLVFVRSLCLSSLNGKTR